MKRIRVCHIITGLNTGGAEMMLANLLRVTDRSRFDPVVISLRPLGPVAGQIRTLEIPVYSIELQRMALAPVALVRLTRLIWALQPALIQTWMPHANFLGGIAGALAGRIPVVWGVHQNRLDSEVNSRSLRAITRVCANLSGSIPTRIVYCAKAALRAHEVAGFDRTRSTVIPNGFDLARFHPDTKARNAFREEISVPNKCLLVGSVGRWAVDKDYHTFFRAAEKCASERSDVCFVLAGAGLTRRNHDLVSLAQQAGVLDRTYLLGERTDIRRVLSALDVFTLSSKTEAFPMTLGEAMACGRMSVATDTGDSAVLLGNCGLVVPTEDPFGLAEAWKAALALTHAEREAVGQRARSRIQREFSLQATAEKYQRLYREVHDESIPRVHFSGNRSSAV